jgi:hypothetical protein
MPKSIRHYLGPVIIEMEREETCQGGRLEGVGRLPTGQAEMASAR